MAGQAQQWIAYPQNVFRVERVLAYGGDEGVILNPFRPHEGRTLTVKETKPPISLEALCELVQDSFAHAGKVIECSDVPLPQEPEGWKYWPTACIGDELTIETRGNVTAVILWGTTVSMDHLFNEAGPSSLE